MVSNCEKSSDAGTRSPVQRGRKKSSFIWQHMTSTEVDGRDKTTCNYCDKWWFLDSSTSNAQTHLKSKHPEKLASTSPSKKSPKSLRSKQPDKLPEQDAATTPASSLPSTSSSEQIHQQSYGMRESDMKLGKSLLCSHFPQNVLDNVRVDMFLRELWELWIQQSLPLPTATAPALANFALLMANGNPIKYVEILNDLYMDNGLEAPDFTRFLNQ